MASGCAADAEIDSSGAEFVQHAIDLRDPVGAIVVPKYGTGAQADPRRTLGGRSDEHLGRSSDERRMVFGKPNSFISLLMGNLCHEQVVLERLCRGFPLAARRIDRRWTVSWLCDIFQNRFRE
jgi:hypothetical protein